MGSAEFEAPTGPDPGTAPVTGPVRSTPATRRTPTRVTRAEQVLDGPASYRRIVVSEAREEPMDDESLFAELLRRLDMDDGSAQEASDQNGILISRWQGRALDSPYVLHVTPSTLGAHLRTMDAKELFPKATPETGALQLFLVHVEEAIETAPEGRSNLVIRPSGVCAQADAPPHNSRHR